MTKTPFELRMDLLNFAHSQLTGEYYSAQQRVLDSTKEYSQERIDGLSQLKYPTQEDIILLATTLKNFVDSK
jgi:hypothetical protein